MVLSGMIVHITNVRRILIYKFDKVIRHIIYYKISVNLYFSTMNKCKRTITKYQTMLYCEIKQPCIFK